MTNIEKQLIDELIAHDIDKDSCGYIAIRLRQLNKCSEMLVWLKKYSDANQEEIFEYLDLLEEKLG